MNKIRGVCPPIITIFREDGSIDWAANEKQADFLIQKGVSGLAFLGTSGEFGMLSQKEKLEFIRHMTDYVNKRTLVLIGVGSTCFADVIELLRCAKDAGADGSLLVNPYFSIYSDEMVEAWMDAVASAVDIPIVIYNIPSYTGYCYPFSVVRELVEKHDNIVGIKDTVGDLSHIKEMVGIKKIRPDFAVFCAYEDQALGALCNGADGFINATANFAPEFTVGLYHAFRDKRYEEAHEYYRKMCRAMDMYALSNPLLLACKQAVYTRVLCRDGGERLPGLPLSPEKKELVREKLQELGLLA